MDPSSVTPGQPEQDSTEAESRKRQLEAEGDLASDQPKKQARAVEGKDDELTCRVLAESKYCGGLIGRAGKSITQIRTDSGAMIEVQKPVPRTSKRVIEIKGSAANVIEASKMICKRITEVAVESSRRGQNPATPSPTPGVDTREMEFVLLVPTPQIGAIIGKGGATIASTRADTGARVIVSSSPMANGTERTATITGSHTTIGAALERMLSQLNECPERGPPKIPYVPAPEGGFPNPAIAAGSPFNFGGGFGSPGGFSGGGSGRGNFGGNFGAFGGGSPGGGSPGGFGESVNNFGSGGFSQGAYRGSGGSGGQYGGQANNYGQTYGYGAPGSSGNFGNFGGQNFGNSPGRSREGSSDPGASQENQVVPLPVPKARIGAVIGRGGSTISAIRRQTGANIRIEDPAENSDERMITVEGPNHAVRLALSMIQSHIQPPQ